MSFCDLCYTTTAFKTNIVIPSLSSIVTRLDNIRFVFLLTGRDDSRKMGRPQESGQSRRSKFGALKGIFCRSGECQKVSRQVREMFQLNGNRDKTLARVCKSQPRKRGDKAVSTGS